MTITVAVDVDDFDKEVVNACVLMGQGITVSGVYEPRGDYAMRWHTYVDQSIFDGDSLHTRSEWEVLSEAEPFFDDDHEQHYNGYFNIRHFPRSDIRTVIVQFCEAQRKLYPLLQVTADLEGLEE